MDVAAQEQNNLLAFRSSCDRCRYMKLKCSSNGNETHEACERCQKAKLRCTYSRRTRLRRRTPAGQDHGTDLPDGHEGQMAASDITMDGQGSGNGDESPGSIDVRAPEVACEPIDASCFSNALDTMSEELFWAEWDIPSTSSGSSSLRPSHSSSFPDYKGCTSAKYTLSLSNLAVELGECLQMLRGDLRTQQSIDDYPIGHVLHLSQTFVTSAHDRPSHPNIDVSTCLLLLNCYVTLRKLYINALSNIRDHLPEGNYTQQQISQDPRTIRLRGMDVLSERYMRSYTAFNITLDSLHNCDAALALCTVCRPPGRPDPSRALTSPVQFSQSVTMIDGSGSPNEELCSNTACVACSIPASIRKEAVSVFSAIEEQELVLHEIIAALRGTLRQRMGLL